jgi:hypothetical protein
MRTLRARNRCEQASHWKAYTRNRLRSRSSAYRRTRNTCRLLQTGQRLRVAIGSSFLPDICLSTQTGAADESGADAHATPRFSGSLLRDPSGRPIVRGILAATVLIDSAIQDIHAVHAAPAPHPGNAAQIFHVDKSFLHHQAIASLTIHGPPPYPAGIAAHPPRGQPRIYGVRITIAPWRAYPRESDSSAGLPLDSVPVLSYTVWGEAESRERPRT